MTTQTLILDNAARVSDSSTQAQSAGSTVAQQRARLIEAMKSQYPVDQQVKYLHLQAEADSLLQQLQALKQQRQADGSATPSQP